MSTQASIRRIVANRFTEADAKALLLDARQQLRHLRFVREIGDLVAHTERDQGLAQSHIALMVGRFTMMAKYQVDGEPFPSNGQCDWWLKPYMIGQLALFDRRTLRDELGGDYKRLKAEITSYFEAGDFPTKLVRPPDRRANKILNHLIQFLKVDTVSAFQPDQVQKELSELCHFYGVPLERVESMLGCIAVLFHGAKFLMPDKQTISAICRVEEREPELVQVNGQNFVRVTRFGPLVVEVAIPVRGENELSWGFCLFRTDLQSELFVSDALYFKGDDGLPFYSFPDHLAFDSTLGKPIVAA